MICKKLNISGKAGVSIALNYYLNGQPKENGQLQSKFYVLIRSLYSFIHIVILE